jgi:hypothetical protein
MSPQPPTPEASGQAFERSLPDLTATVVALFADAAVADAEGVPELMMAFLPRFAAIDEEILAHLPPALVPPLREPDREALIEEFNVRQLLLVLEQARQDNPDLAAQVEDIRYAQRQIEAGRRLREAMDRTGDLVATLRTHLCEQVEEKMAGLVARLSSLDQETLSEMDLPPVLRAPLCLPQPGTN